ncbi:MAG: NUDIX domain-containing protein [Cytophagales bacterium]|jgi:bifunctional NMN adenylyltransferase/nudix hydrolase|nr:NUDIX domain-containing protein [Cytophagales bacterium]MCA6386534.1 NUDIX domain-containing protein [Cytophagales bacterium]MCA6389956.1 NUDIX domain-containing protein [Cytophagales bacterium]MCA6395089.1 NUDIX domain-containing protein [Cytophagales bacterium]MCA6398116.1 NUDIX domain-containing protein [Cytophagales bacterium]
MKTIGVIIARFQSPYLHEGHKALVDSVQKNHNKTVIVLGVSPVLGSRKNPLDFHTREKMIKKEYPEVVVLPLSDHPLDTKWSQNLDNLLSNSFPGSSFKLFGSRDSFIKYYSGHCEVVELPESGPNNATLIRERISDKVLDSEEFRTGVIYAYSNTYLKVYPTVDIAVFRNNKIEMLLGKKEIDNKWRLLGGFSDPTDESFEAAARRELTEECGAIEITEMKYEKSFRVNDWRYQSEADKIITSLFSTDFISGNPAGSDDIAEVKWFKLDEIQSMMDQQFTAEEHIPQLSLLMKKYNTK